MTVYCKFADGTTKGDGFPDLTDGMCEQEDPTRVETGNI